MVYIEILLHRGKMVVGRFSYKKITAWANKENRHFLNNVDLGLTTKIAHLHVYVWKMNLLQKLYFIPPSWPVKPALFWSSRSGSWSFRTWSWRTILTTVRSFHFIQKSLISFLLHLFFILPDIINCKTIGVNYKQNN